MTIRQDPYKTTKTEQFDKVGRLNFCFPPAGIELPQYLFIGMTIYLLILGL